MTNLKSLYPKIKPFKTWHLKVSEIHTICIDQVGNPEGIPILYLHGGPGAGISPSYYRYFDPEKFHVILVDQRGCNRSTPLGCTEENTTSDLIEDFERIRKELNIKKWVLCGGSWGSTLSLAYAQAFPEVVSAMILRGVFLGRPEDLDWLYKYGMSEIFPEQYEKYLSILPPEDRDDPVEGYYKLSISGDREKELSAAKEIWNLSLRAMNMGCVEALGFNFSDELFLAAGKIVIHYQLHGYFLRDKKQIVNNFDKIKHIPTRIIHGRFDVITNYNNAYIAHKNIDNSELIVAENSCHSADEPEIIHHIVDSEDWLLKLTN